MSNLLSIESAFLNLPQVKQALNLSEIRSVQRTITNAKKKKFEQTLTLSKLVKSAVEWFNSEEGKQACNNEGISWSNEEIGLKVFGWQKSFFYKVVKAGKLAPEVIESFNTKCNEAEANSEEPNRSLEGLLKFAKVVEISANGGGGEEDGNEPEIEVRTQTILTLSYKTDEGNVAVRIDSEGKLKTQNTKEQILQAIAFLQFTLNQ